MKVEVGQTTRHRKRIDIVCEWDISSRVGVVKEKKRRVLTAMIMV